MAILLLIAGVLLVIVTPNFKKKGETPHSISRNVLLWQISGIGTGCLTASIGAIYGKLGLCLGSAIQASTISFLIATIVIAVMCIGNGKLGRIHMTFKKGNPWWMWLGGVCGAIAVFGNSWLIPQIGAGAFFMALLLGQMLLGLLMENYGWMGAIRKRISYVQLTGIALMIAGVVIIRT